MKENHFDDDHKFGSEQGMNLAVAVNFYLNSITNQTIDPSYGRLKFTKIAYGQNENGEFFSSINELETHACGEEELGLSGDDHKFWPIRE